MRRLTAAAVLAALEVALLSAVLLYRDTKQATFFMTCLAVKLPFCWLLARRSAAAWFAIALYEVTGLYAGLLAPKVPGALRVAESGLAAAVLVLLVTSLSALPRPTLELPEP